MYIIGILLTYILKYSKPSKNITLWRLFQFYISIRIFFSTWYSLEKWSHCQK